MVDQVSYKDMMASHLHRQGILEIANNFEAKVVDMGSEAMVLELVSWNSRVDAFMNMLRPFGIIEAARSGTIAMARSPVASLDDDKEKKKTEVKLEDLPPS